MIIILAGASIQFPGAAAELRISQLFGGPPSGAGSRQIYQSRFGLSRDDRLSTNHGCWSEVWFGTKSRISFRPRLVRRGDQSVEVAKRAEHRVDAAIVGNVVAEIRHRRRVDRRDPHRVDAERFR